MSPNAFDPDSIFPDRLPDLEMGEEHGLEESGHGKTWEEFTGGTTGTRYIRGTGGGCIMIRKDGAVLVWWDRTAALATYAKGNHGAPMTRGGAKGMPSEFDDLFKLVSACRRYHASDGSECPEDPTDPDAATFARAFRHLSWRMLRAVGNGDFQFLSDLAKQLETHEKLFQGSLQIDTEEFEAVSRAIQRAVLESNSVPTRAAVKSEFEKEEPKNLHRQDYRYILKSMGFGWLPAGRDLRT